MKAGTVWIKTTDLKAILEMVDKYNMSSVYLCVEMVDIAGLTVNGQDTIKLIENEQEK